MAVPDSLPQRIFLLAYDPARGRVRAGSHLGAMLRAAALADLHRHGHLTDVDGRAAVTTRRPHHDPILEALYAEIAGAKPRKWHWWIGRRQTPTVTAVRRQLADGGWIRLEPRRILGLFPTTRVTIRNPRVRTELRSSISLTLKNPLARTDPADAALVAIAAAANLTLVLPRKTQRASRRRIEQLTARSGPAAPALRRAIQEAAAAAAG